MNDPFAHAVLQGHPKGGRLVADLVPAAGSNQPVQELELAQPIRRVAWSDDDNMMPSIRVQVRNAKGQAVRRWSSATPDAPT